MSSESRLLTVAEEELVHAAREVVFDPVERPPFTFDEPELYLTAWSTAWEAARIAICLAAITRNRGLMQECHKLMLAIESASGGVCASSYRVWDLLEPVYRGAE